MKATQSQLLVQFEISNWLCENQLSLVAPLREGIQFFLDFFYFEIQNRVLPSLQLSGATQLKWQLENDLQVVSTSIKWNRKLWTV